MTARKSRKLSQNEKIRRAYARGMTRSAIAHRFNVPYQTVYKATSGRHAPKEWRERIAAINEANTAARDTPVEPLTAEEIAAIGA